MNEKSKAHRGGQLRENVMQVVFLIAACISILAVALICIYLFANGIPAIAEIGPFQFLLGTDWRPNADHYGIFPMILGSIYVTAGAIIVGVPLGLLAAWLVLINTVTFLIFGVDKLLAKHPRFRQRVPEKNLLLLAVVGGSVGALLGMYLFRHKTLHRVFRVGVPVILAVQLLLAAAIALYWNFLQ